MVHGIESISADATHKMEFLLNRTARHNSNAVNKYLKTKKSSVAEIKPVTATLSYAKTPAVQQPQQYTEDFVNIKLLHPLKFSLIMFVSF